MSTPVRIGALLRFWLPLQATWLKERREIDKLTAGERVVAVIPHGGAGGGDIFAGETDPGAEEGRLAMVDPILVAVGHVNQASGQAQAGAE